MIKKFTEYINEMANISLKGKKVFADDNLLKNMKFTELQDNLVMYHEKNGNWLYPKGKFFIYFTDSSETTQKICNGEYDMIQFPIRTSFNAFTVAPITDIWKVKHLNKYKGGNHFIGIVEGFTDGNKILIQMMSVNKKYKGNKINTFMLDAVRDELGNNLQLVWEDPTDEGYEFILKYDNSPEFKFTSGFRPKKFIE